MPGTLSSGAQRDAWRPRHIRPKPLAPIVLRGPETLAPIVLRGPETSILSCVRKHRLHFTLSNLLGCLRSKVPVLFLFMKASGGACLMGVPENRFQSALSNGRKVRRSREPVPKFLMERISVSCKTRSTRSVYQASPTRPERPNFRGFGRIPAEFCSIRR